MPESLFHLATRSMLSLHAVLACHVLLVQQWVLNANDLQNASTYTVVRKISVVIVQSDTPSVNTTILTSTFQVP